MYSRIEKLELAGLAAALGTLIVVLATVLTAVILGGRLYVTVGGPMEYGLDIAGISLGILGVLLSIRRTLKRQ